MKKIVIMASIVCFYLFQGKFAGGQTYVAENYSDLFNKETPEDDSDKLSFEERVNIVDKLQKFYIDDGFAIEIAGAYLVLGQLLSRNGKPVGRYVIGETNLNEITLKEINKIEIKESVTELQIQIKEITKTRAKYHTTNMASENLTLLYEELMVIDKRLKVAKIKLLIKEGKFPTECCKFEIVPKGTLKIKGGVSKKIGGPILLTVVLLAPIFYKYFYQDIEPSAEAIEEHNNFNLFNSILNVNLEDGLDEYENGVISGNPDFLLNQSALIDLVTGGY